MERLTIREENEIYVCCGERIDITEKEIINMLAEKLAAYEDAEEQGRLVALPCKVGDTVYTIGEGILRLGGGKERWICEHKPDSFYITVEDEKWKLSAPCEIADWGFEGIDEIGSFDGKFYVTREEAEKALEGMG